jgi:ribulose-bisphosphate carboxylase large chain
VTSEQENYESIICQDSVDPSKYIIVTYFLSSSDNKHSLFDLAWNLAVGQSIGNPNTRSLFETDEMILKHSCKILEKREELSKKQEGIVHIGFPIVNINLENDGISQMLCHFMGGQLDINMFEKCVLKDFKLPEQSKKHFLGPKYGIKGVRDFLNNHDRPLLGAIIKPKVGATKEVLLEMTKQLVEGGVEFIKEDEIMSNPDIAPLEERVPYIMNYLNSIEKKVIYCFSITSDFPYCIERVKQVYKLGGNGVHINFWSGLGVYNSIRKLDLPIFLHFQKSGDKILTNKKHNFHIEWPVICKIARMGGADFIHAGMWGGYYHEEEEDLQKTITALTGGEDYKGTVPALSGGMHPGLVGAVRERFGNDVMCSCGGSIHGHPSGTLSGTKAMRQAIDATIQGVDLENANLQSELKEAIDKWGYVKYDLPKDQNFNIVIPMAGRGQRWKDAGYIFPKPLIEIKNKPMIQVVLENINLKGNYIFICLKEDVEKFSLDTVLKNLKPDCKIITIDEITEGAAVTILKAKELINKDEPLIIANCDQWVNWSSSKFIDFIDKRDPDGAIVTFTSTHPRNSFVRLNNENKIVEIAEKKLISNIANAGIFYHKSGTKMINAIEKMIQKNIKTNNEFFLSGAYNEMDLEKEEIAPYHVEEVKSMGTPEELENSWKTNWNK